MRASCFYVPVKLVDDFCEWMPGDNLLEELEARVTLVRIRKVSDGCAASKNVRHWYLRRRKKKRNVRPGYHRYQRYPHYQSVLDTVCHEEGSKYTATEDGKP